MLSVCPTFYSFIYLFYHFSSYFEAPYVQVQSESAQVDAHLANPSRVLCHRLWRVERPVMVRWQETDRDSAFLPVQSLPIWEMLPLLPSCDLQPVGAPLAAYLFVAY